jgi:hypothetical protein
MVDMSLSDLLQRSSRQNEKFDEFPVFGPHPKQSWRFKFAMQFKPASRTAEAAQSQLIPATGTFRTELFHLS